MKYLISYTTRTENNRRCAIWVEWMLRELGHETIMQEYDFLPGRNFMDLMDRALVDSDYVIGILTKEYLQSTNCVREWTNAYAQDKFIPIRIDNCNPKGLLHCVIYIDLFNKDSNSAKEELRKRLASPIRPASEPQPPFFKQTIPEPDFPVWENSDAAHENRLEFLDDFIKRQAALNKKSKNKSTLKEKTIVTLTDEHYYLTKQAILGDLIYFLAIKLDEEEKITDESVIFEEIICEDGIYLEEVKDEILLNKLATIFTVQLIDEVEKL